MLSNGDRTRTKIEVVTAYTSLGSDMIDGWSESGSERIHWVDWVDDDRSSTNGGCKQTSRSWIWRTGERRSQSCDMNVVARRYGENEQRRKGETRRAKRMANMVYREAPNEYSGTTVRRNCQFLLVYEILDRYIAHLPALEEHLGPHW